MTPPLVSFNYEAIGRNKWWDDPTANPFVFFGLYLKGIGDERKEVVG